MFTGRAPEIRIQRSWKCLKVRIWLIWIHRWTWDEIDRERERNSNPNRMRISNPNRIWIPPVGTGNLATEKNLNLMDLFSVYWNYASIFKKERQIRKGVNHTYSLKMNKHKCLSKKMLEGGHFSNTHVLIASSKETYNAALNTLQFVSGVQKITRGIFKTFTCSILP